MIFIYGLRDFGRVDAHGGEYAQTRFFHIWFAPLFPVGSSWVTGRRADGTNAHGIKLYGKSVAAGYLRVWAPILGIGLLSAGISQQSVASLVFSGVALALAAWSWTWRTLRGAAAHRRSDFNFVAYGTRCEPKRMFDSHRVRVKKDLDRRWIERTPKRSPNEVAQHGADDAAEAVLAYGLLRLSATDGRAEDGRDADRILAGQHDAPSTTDGPYRAGPASATDADTQAGLAALVEQRAAEGANQAAKFAIDPEVAKRRAKRRGRWQLAGLVLMTMASAGGLMGFVASLEPAKDVSIRQLRGTNPAKYHVVNVQCDTIDPPLWYETDRNSDTITARIAMCWIGKYALPVKYDGLLAGKRITGKLHAMNNYASWQRELHATPDLDARSLDVYVDATDTNELGIQLFALGLAGATCVLWLLWFRARRRRLAVA